MRIATTQSDDCTKTAASCPMKYRPESIILSPRDVQPLVHDEPRETLCGSAASEPRLAELDGETLVQCDARCKNVKSTGTPCAGGIERERQVVRVTCVLGADARRGRRKPHIHAVGNQVGQRRRSRRALRQVRRRESLQNAPSLVGAVRHLLWSARKHMVGRAMRADRGEQACNTLRISCRSKDTEHARGRNASEEALQIEPQQKRPSAVRRGESEQAAAWAESMRQFMRRYQVEDAVKHAALNGAQACLGHFEQAAPSAALRKPSIAVIPQRLIGGEAAQSFSISQEVHHRNFNSQKIGKVPRRGQLRHWPATLSHPRRQCAETTRRDWIAVLRAVPQPSQLQRAGEFIATSERRLRELRPHLAE